MESAAPTIDAQSAPEARLLSMASDLLGTAGPEGRLRLVNPAWSRLLGWEAARLSGAVFAELVHPDDRARAVALVERSGPDEQTCRMLCADGGERCVLWSARADGVDELVYLAGRDVSDRERARAELQEFAYVASHDLAEPLRMVTSYLELLQRRYGGRLDETADEFIDHAVAGAGRMRALIDGLLEYSRVGSHQMRGAPIDLRELVAVVVGRIERLLDETGAEVEVHGRPAAARGDATQIAQLLQSLIVNALRFHAPGRAPRVRVTAEEHEGGVRVSVADDGIGIPESHQERIFRMFARLHGRDEYEGTGIGLAVCRRIAERHGGRIWVESAPGAGSTFHVWLPG